MNQGQKLLHHSTAISRPLHSAAPQSLLHRVMRIPSPEQLLILGAHLGAPKSKICEESENDTLRFPLSKKPLLDFLRPYKRTNQPISEKSFSPSTSSGQASGEKSGEGKRSASNFGVTSNRSRCGKNRALLRTPLLNPKIKGFLCGPSRQHLGMVP